MSCVLWFDKINKVDIDYRMQDNMFFELISSVAVLFMALEIAFQEIGDKKNDLLVEDEGNWANYMECYYSYLNKTYKIFETAIKGEGIAMEELKYMKDAKKWADKFVKSVFIDAQSDNGNVPYKVAIIAAKFYNHYLYFNAKLKLLLESYDDKNSKDIIEIVNSFENNMRFIEVLKERMVNNVQNHIPNDCMDFEFLSLMWDKNKNIVTNNILREDDSLICIMI